MDIENIIVCMKQIPDPECPISAYSIDDKANKVVVRGVPPVLSPFDENALEAALRIKDRHGAKVTVLSMGPSLSKAVVRKSLAAGADELVLLEDEAFADADSYSIALTLATAIRKMGKYDLIFTGIQAADWNAGLVGSGIAEILGIPSITVASRVEINNGRVKVVRIVSDGHEVIEAPLPALITVSNELGEMRSTNIQAIMAVQKKPITVWKAQDLGIEPSSIRKTTLLKLFIPKTEANCEIVNGETAEEAGIILAHKLREAKLI